jgi:hypothetical protein
MTTIFEEEIRSPGDILREHLDYMAFPRTAAAEVVWGTQVSLDSFRPRLTRRMERLTAMGVHFRPLDDL